MKVVVLFIIFLIQLNLIAETESLILDIKKSIELGLKNNYDILINRVDLEISRNSWIIAKRGKGFKTDITLEYNITQDYDTRKGSIIALHQYLPTGGEVKLTGSLNQTELKPLFYGSPENTTLKYGIEFSHPFFTLNQYRLKRKKSYLQYQIKKYNYEDFKKQFIIEVITSFYSIVSLIENIKISTQIYDSARKLYKLTEQKFKKGITKDVDLLEAELQLIKKEIELEQLKFELNNQITEFKNLLRIKQDIKFVYEIEKVFFPTNVKLEVNKKIVDQNPVIISKKYNLELMQLSIEDIKAYAGIKFSLSVEYERFGENSNSEQAIRDFSEQWIVGVKLQIPIFDWGISSKQIDNTKLKKYKEYLNLKKEKDMLIVDIENCRREVYIRKAEIKLKAKAEKQAKRDLRLKIEKYRKGLVNVDDVIRAQNNYLEAGYNLIKAKIDFILSKIEWAYLTGENLY